MRAPGDPAGGPPAAQPTNGNIRRNNNTNIGAGEGVVVHPACCRRRRCCHWARGRAWQGGRLLPPKPHTYCTFGSLPPPGLHPDLKKWQPGAASK